MNHIIDFENLQNFKVFLQEKGINNRNFINLGGEGCCYHSPTDDLAYKIFHRYFEEFYCKEEQDDLEEDYIESGRMLPTMGKIITTHEVSSNQFLFPINLFTNQNNLLGYTSKYVPKNLFDNRKIQKQNWIYQIPFDRVLKAYEDMSKEVEKLSKKQVKIFDLAANLIFDGDHLYGIDTLGYQFQEGDLLKENLESLKIALIHVFSMWEMGKGKPRNTAEIQKIDVEEYLKDLKREYVSKRKIKMLS